MKYDIHSSEPQTVSYVAEQIWERYATPEEKCVGVSSFVNGHPLLIIGSETYTQDLLDLGTGRTYFVVLLEDPNKRIYSSDLIDAVTGTDFSVRSEKPRVLDFDEKRFAEAVEQVKDALG